MSARRVPGTARRLALAAALACLPLPARGQGDSVTVVAGPHYRRGSALELLLGSGYRAL